MMKLVKLVSPSLYLKPIYIFIYKITLHVALYCYQTISVYYSKDKISILWKLNGLKND